MIDLDKLLRCLAEALARYHDCELTPSDLSDSVVSDRFEEIYGITLLDEDKPAPSLDSMIQDENLDDQGVPSKFINRCSICGELGRNARTHQDTLVNGSYHWRPS